MRFFRVPGTERRALADRVVEQARSYLGYEAMPNRVQRFGPDGLAWDGAFVDVCLAKGGVPTAGMPRHRSATAALQYYVRERRAYRDPKPGDVVFFAFPSDADPSLGQPHVGIVTDTEKWFTYGEFSTVEGETASGLPRASTLPIGVFEHTRYGTDVLLFGRPDYQPGRHRNFQSVDGLPRVRPAHFRPGKAHRSVELVQEALGQTVGLREARRGVWDEKSISAYRAWQRLRGLTGPAANGVPDDMTLLQLQKFVNGKWVVIA